MTSVYWKLSPGGIKELIFFKKNNIKTKKNLYSQGIICALGKVGWKMKTYKWKPVFNEY